MARYNTEPVEEEFPDVLPDPYSLAKRWVWKDESGSLEQVSTGAQMMGEKNATNMSKSKTKKSVNAVRFPDMQKMNQKLSKMNPVGYGNRSLKNGTSPRPSTKANRNENRLITLQDIKKLRPFTKSKNLYNVSTLIFYQLNETLQQFLVFVRRNHLRSLKKPPTDLTNFSLLTDVASDLLSDELSDVHNQFLQTEQFDNFLMTLLYYFEAYFERKNLENKPRPMATEPSAAEKQAMSSALSKQTAAQKLLSSKYCTLILGLGIQEQHHLACGKQRKSYTRKDRSLYETIYTFNSYAVWICFRRKDLELITQEIGRQFRSDTFNPASRPENSDFKLASDLTKEENPDFNLAPYSARHRQKRPAIKSIVNQRSPVLVSLLPTSQEATPWLLDRRKGLLAALGEIQHQEDVTATLPLRIGIIGEAMVGFNPITLAPFGEEHDEDNANQGSFSRSLSQDEKDPPAHSSDQETLKEQHEVKSN